MCGVSAKEYSSAHGAQINFGDLTYGSSIPWIDLIGWAMPVRANRALSLKVEVFFQVSDHVMLLPEQYVRLYKIKTGFRQGFGSGSGLDQYSIGPVDPDPAGQK